MSEQDFSNLDPTLKDFGNYLVKDIQVDIEKINKRLEVMDKKLDAAIAGNQVLMGWFTTIDALVVVSIKTRSERELEFISETWNRITAFDQIEGPPIAKEAALESYQRIKEFLSVGP